MAIGKSFWQLEYETVSGQFQTFLSLYLKTFGIYLAILGVLLKFTFDDNATHILSVTMSIFGMFCCLLLFVCIYFAEQMTRKLHKKRQAALDNLEVDTENEILSARWASIVFSIFNSIAIIGWFIILQSFLTCSN